MAIKSAYVTATTSAADVVINGPAAGVAVINLDGAGVVSFRNDGTAAASATDENFRIPALAGAARIIRVQKWPATISVIATTSTVLQIEAVDE